MACTFQEIESRAEHILWWRKDPGRLISSLDIVHDYLEGLERGRNHEDLEARQAEASCRPRILELLTKDKLQLRKSIGDRGVQDIVGDLKMRKSKEYRAVQDIVGDFKVRKSKEYRAVQVRLNLRKTVGESMVSWGRISRNRPQREGCLCSWSDILEYIDILEYFNDFNPEIFDRPQRRITSIQQFSMPSSELSTFLEELSTVLGEISTILEAISTIFVDFSTFVSDSVDTQGPSEHHSVAYAVIVSAVALLSFVYQYLLGYVDRGGSKADSSGSLEFRDTYISIVLFQGSYIWIKSRDVASKPVPKTAIKEELKHKSDGSLSVRYEPRFKPHKEEGVVFERIALRTFPTRIEAEVVYRTAASCYEYGKDYGPEVDLGDGRFFTIPSMSEEEQRLSGMEKVAMVKVRARRVHELFIKEEAARNPPPAALPGADLVRQFLLADSEGHNQFRWENALLQLPGNQTQHSEMQGISMQMLQHHDMQTSQPQLQELELLRLQQRIEELTRQNSQLENQVRESAHLQQQIEELTRKIEQLENQVLESAHPQQDGSWWTNQSEESA